MKNNFKTLKNNIIKGISVDLKTVFKGLKLTEEQMCEIFLLGHIKTILWLCETQIMEEAFMHKHKEYISFPIISRYQKLSNRFILRYQDVLDMKAISRYQKLSLNFIETNINILDIRSLSCNVVMDKLDYEKFIELNKDNEQIDWGMVSLRKLSRKFMIKNRKTLIPSGLLLFNNKILIEMIFGRDTVKYILNKVAIHNTTLKQLAFEDYIDQCVNRNLINIDWRRIATKPFTKPFVNSHKELTNCMRMSI